MDPRIAARFGEATGLLGDTQVKLVEHGPLAWLQTPVGPAFGIGALFLRGGKWVSLAGLVAFREALAQSRPPIDAWEPIVSAHAALTHDQPLLTRDDVADLADPRWYVLPLGAAAFDAWHAPRTEIRAAGGADGARELVWFVEHFPHRGEMGRVRVSDRYEVAVEPVSR